jgi:uncharacterized membrane protein SpoIIM required for sporulation
MKETTFINKYKDKWKDLEGYLQKRGNTDPDYLSSLYVQLTDDLSYAKTHYPDSKVTIYLNQLSSKLHIEIYKNKKEKSSRFVTFWTQELPLTIYRKRYAVLISFLGLLISFAIGWISSANDDGFVRLVLGDVYVDKTEQLIDEGDPLGIYGLDNEVNMFFRITGNNIFVCIVFFILGIFVGIGSIYKIVETGIMLGAFIYMFYSRDLTGDALMAIWMHGVVEITICVFSGAAGIVMGTSFLFTGTYTRGESLLRGAKDGLKILFGVIPFLVLAGFIESFVTRHYQNSLLSLTTILLSLGLVISYFIVYPVVVSRRMKKLAMSGFQYGYQYPEYRIKLVVGALWLVGGFLATLLTFQSGQRIGILFTGAIVTGAVKIIQGLNEMSKARKKRVA